MIKKLLISVGMLCSLIVGGTQLSASEIPSNITKALDTNVVVYSTSSTIYRGSGTIVTPSGYILTANHVVIPGSMMSVTLQDGKTYDAKLAWNDPVSDSALLKVTTDHPLPYTKIDFKHKNYRGEPIYQIGNGNWKFFQIHPGFTIDVNRNLQNPTNVTKLDGKTYPLYAPYPKEDEHHLVVDAAIRPGDSGGGVLDSQGELIAIVSKGGGEMNIGLNIPAWQIESRLTPDLIKSLS